MSLEEMLEEIKQVANGEKINVAFCGGMDPKDYTAAGSVFPEGRLLAYPNYEKTYNAVESGECDAVVLPFEKSYTGEVGKVLDLMYSGNLKVNRVFSVDNGSETVRYAVMTREESELPADTANECLLMMFTVQDEVGGLAKAVNAISDNGFNMSIMRSRHMKNLPWNYYFYVEAQGSDSSENGMNMIAALKEVCPTVKVVGRYVAE